MNSSLVDPWHLRDVESNILGLNYVFLAASEVLAPLTQSMCLIFLHNKQLTRFGE